MVSAGRTDSSTASGRRRFDGMAPVGYRTLAEQVAGSIRRAIAEGRIPPSARLLEFALARELGVSRAPIREALGLLEREGLVVKEPNRGARVVELTEETVREVASLRALLEAFAASLAAKRLTSPEMAEFEDIMARMHDAGRRGDSARVVELDYEFHAAICRASGHRTLFETWSAMSGKIRLYLSTTNLMYRDLNAIVRGHLDIVAALRARHPKRAAQAIQDHLGERLDARAALIAGANLRRQRSDTFRESRRARRLAVARLSATRTPRGATPR
ncbi:MAG TPA: GntR family transcriptional regulator [Candidatus Baltobacteraceae bacterium]|nr:GntR family transcriptional regulator [Candidatus Baltobacteraceae bacterium]